MNDMMMVKKTQVEMVHDRGFQLPKDELFILHFDANNASQVKRLKNLTVNQHYKKIGDDDTSLYVYYALEDKLIDDVKAFVKHMVNHTDGIIVVNADDVNKLKQRQYKEHLD